ncbi:hypothetical protein GCM10010171_48100 [Actinokineospora fastidiosa]|uniref:Uncharacterized protein n=1 Tax=Actinokineospora fastidiosa TaxID=1816 RepID=A0A918LHH0_9PSEU|nr:hypothetical protein GCM10010171_48100 [Actinokineospora fastidiosa]
MVEHADPAGEIQDPPAVAGAQPRPLGGLDQFAAESERGHEGDLAAADVTPVQVVHLFRRERFALLDANEVGHSQTVFIRASSRLRLDGWNSASAISARRLNTYPVTLCWAIVERSIPER